MNSLKPLISPVVLSTTFAHKHPGQMGYSRVDNPTRLELEKQLGALEGGRFALAFSSGSAALSAVFSLLKTGDRVVSHSQVYEGTSRMLHDVFSRFGIKSTAVDFNDEKKLKEVSGKANMLVCEPVTNPCLRRLNLEKIARIKGKALFVVDNTMLTPVFLKPLQNGADMVVHSLTKFISGHHDVIAGAVVTNNARLFRKLRYIQWTLGAIPGPQDCFLVMRGIQTLKIRMQKHQDNARHICAFLKSHPKVEKVAFPGMSGMISFWTKGNKAQTVRSLMSLGHIKTAHSFGGTSTTIMHPLSMMTWTLPLHELERQEIRGNLLRMSVGLEDPLIVIQDLQELLNSL